MKFQNTALTVLAALGLGVVSTQASAFSVLVQNGNSFSTQAGVTQIDLGLVPVMGVPGNTGDIVYSGTAAGQGYTFADGSLYTASVPSVTAQPTGSQGAFWSVGKTPLTQAGPGVLTFAGAGVAYVGFLWGSVDSYNAVSFYSGATLLGSYTGNNVVAGANGTQTRYFNAWGGAQKITRVEFASPLQNALETDNFAVSAVPEPESYAMLLAGLGLMGTIIRRRNKSKAA